MGKKVKIKRVDKSLPLPKYVTKGATCFDVYVRKETKIQPKEVKLVPSNLIIEVPCGYMLIIACRSSTPKHSLLMPHGFGIIDQDFCGENDEIMLQFYNFSEKPVILKRGQRIAQAAFVKIEKFDWQEVIKINQKTRGGFGSTGDK